MLGTKSGIEEYTNHLKNMYNVELLHQVPSSPETNLLDLGVWMAIQSLVEKLSWHDRYDESVLSQQVMNAWNDLQQSTLDKVYKRWELVLNLIQYDNGGNKFIERYRGKLTNDPVCSEDTTDNLVKIETEAKKEKSK